MKSLILGAVLAATIFTACSNNSSTTTRNADSIPSTAVAPKQDSSTTQIPGTSEEIIAAYLQIKNALAADNGSAAADAGKQLSEVVGRLDGTSFSAEQRKVYDDVKDDIKEHADHISANGGKIAHQREHFDVLSKDVYDFVKVVKPTQTLYQDHCPMYNGGKGANWLSEVKDIKNPYLGKKMPDCGTVKEEIKP